MEDPGTADASEPNLDQPSTYFSSLTTGQIMTYYNYASWKLYPVTAIQTGYATTDAKALNTMEVSSSNYLRALTATVAGDKNSATGKYVELKFWLYLQTNDGLTRNIALQDLTITSSYGTTAQQAVVNAIRLGVWGDNTTYGTGGSAGSAYIFGIGNDYDFAFTSAMPGYDASATGSGYIPGTNTFNYMDQLDAAYTLSTAAQSDDLFYSASPIANMSTDTLTSAQTIFAMNPAEATLFTVRIYVEGWDAQALNDLSGAQFNISFKFTIQA